MAATRSMVWIGLLSAALIMMLGNGFRHSFGIFLPPITTDTGWGREVFSLGFALQMFLLGFGAPVAGAVADRWGAGRVLVAGGILQALGLLGVASSTTPTGFVLTAGLVMGLGASAASNVVVIGMAGWMVEEKMLGRAVGIIMAGASMGQIFMLPLAHQLIITFGWVWAMTVMGMMGFLVLPLVLPLVLGQRRRPRERPTQRIGEALQEARGHSGYVLLVSGFFVCGFHVFFLATHLPAYIQDQGLGSGVGATALMLVGIFNMIGANLWGYLGDRFSKKRMLGLIYALRSVVILVFISVPVTQASAYAFACAMGFLWLGTVPLTSGIVRQIFGTQYLSMLYGVVFLSHQVGGFLGSWMAGWIFDRTQSYAIMWGLAIALGIFAALIHQPINEDRLDPTAPAPAV